MRLSVRLAPLHISRHAPTPESSAIPRLQQPHLSAPLGDLVLHIDDEVSLLLRSTHDTYQDLFTPLKKERPPATTLEVHPATVSTKDKSTSHLQPSPRPSKILPGGSKHLGTRPLLAVYPHSQE